MCMKCSYLLRRLDFEMSISRFLKNMLKLDTYKLLFENGRMLVLQSHSTVLGSILFVEKVKNYMYMPDKSCHVS